jgi:hypothetical protein
LGTDLIRFACGTIALCLLPVAAHAQNQTQNQSIDDLKGKIFDAHMTQQTFGGLKFCGELDGDHFYFQPRDRVLALEDYRRSIESLARQGAFNPEKRRPWTDADAAERWEQVKQQAIKDKDNCALVASLPDLERQLDDLEKKSPAAETKK